MIDIWWYLLGYFTIGLTLLEGAQWARRKWHLAPMDRLACILTFTVWPIIIFIAFVLVGRKKK